jgi:hypothetical protein
MTNHSSGLDRGKKSQQARPTWQRCKRRNDEMLAEFEAELDKLRRSFPPPSSDDPIYKYLRRLYRLRCKVENSPELQGRIKALHAAHHSATAKNHAGMIIRLTAPDVTSKMKHKYAAVITYALQNGVEPQNFIGFVKEMGGINKCVEHWSRTGRSGAKKQRPSG